MKSESVLKKKYIVPHVLPTEPIHYCEIYMLLCLTHLHFYTSVSPEVYIKEQKKKKKVLDNLIWISLKLKKKKIVQTTHQNKITIKARYQFCLLPICLYVCVIPWYFPSAVSPTTSNKK